MFNWFLRTQELSGVRGDLAEIGCYLGRSSVLLGDYLARDETLTVIDLFENPALDGANSTENDSAYAGLTQSAFEANYRRVHGDLPVVVRDFSHNITNYAAHATHRFVHIDASHLYEHVKGDIQAARVLAGRDAVIAFDDIREAHTPGVWAAFWEAVLMEQLIPIAVTEHKIYATWGDAALWQNKLLDTAPAGVDHEVQDVLGRPLVRLWTPSSTGPVPLQRRLLLGVTPPALLHRIERFRSRPR